MAGLGVVAATNGLLSGLANPASVARSAAVRLMRPRRLACTSTLAFPSVIHQAQLSESAGIRSPVPGPRRGCSVPPWPGGRKNGACETDESAATEWF